MSQRLELLCQPAGSGKTHQCIQVFRNELLKQTSGFNPRSFFILPNREHVSRVNDLLLRHFPEDKTPPLPGLLNPPVLTINDFLKRLAGATITNTPGDIFRKFLIQSIFEETRFEYFEEAKKHRGFMELAADFMAEAKAALFTEREFQAGISCAVSAGPVFQRKLSDLGKIFSTYNTKLLSFGLEDPEDHIKSFAEAVLSGRLRLELGLVVFDGFYHFSPLQMEFLKAVSKAAGRVIVTLTTDASSERGHVFLYPQETRERLLGMGFSERPRGPVKNHRVHAPALAFLEKNLFRGSVKPWPEKQEAVSIFEATGASGEVEMIAREIVRLYRQGSYHFSDFCVILRSIGPYEEVIRHVFSAFELPVEIHERKKLRQNSFARAFVRWISLVRGGWRREDLFALFKSSYYGFDLEAVRMLEKKALFEGPHEGAEAWQDFCKTLHTPEREILEGLLEAYGKIFHDQTPLAYKTHLLSFIRNHEMLRRHAERDEATREDFYAFRALEKIMDEIILHRSAGGERAMGLQNYLEYLQAAVDISLFSVPVQDKNRVQVYDAILAFQKEYKVIFIAGLLEKNFPQRITEDALLKDDERKILNSQGSRFEERLRRVSGERYFFYMAVTRAQEKLYLTYPRFDLEGKEALPSFYAEEVKRCLGENHVPTRRRGMGQAAPLAEEVCAPRDLLMILIESLFQIQNEEKAEAFFAQLLNFCLEMPDTKKIIREILRDETRASLADPAVLEKIKAAEKYFSASRLETFATCPFRHFAQHVLAMEDFVEGIDPKQRGKLIHRVLEDLYRETVCGDKKDWLVVKNPGRAAERAGEILKEVAPEFPFYGVTKLEQELCLAGLANTLREFLMHESEQEMKRHTVPAEFEKKFGSGEPGGLDFLRIEGKGETVLIRGTIDRIDYDQKAGIAVVIDYKSGAEKATALFKNLEKGIQLQIPIYLLAVNRLLKHKAVAGELYPVAAPAKRKGIYDREAVKEAIPLGRSKGVLEAAEFEGLLRSVEEKIPEYADRIRQGEIRVQSRSCDHCPYDQVCRFEKWKLIYSENEKAWVRKKT